MIVDQNATVQDLKWAIRRALEHVPVLQQERGVSWCDDDAASLLGVAGAHGFG